MAESAIEFVLVDSFATEVLGRALARAFDAGARASAVLYLLGEVGAGKTTCARSLLRALGIDGLIRSPTYTLLESYPAGELQCIHIDLYRLSSALEVDELGLRDYLVDRCLMLVEWPERGGAAVPPADLELLLTYEGEFRRGVMTPRTELGRELVRILLNDTSLTPYLSNLT